MTKKEKELVDYIFGQAENALAYLRINNIDDERILRIYVDSEYKYIEVTVTEFEGGKPKRRYGREFSPRGFRSGYFDRKEQDENS